MQNMILSLLKINRSDWNLETDRVKIQFKFNPNRINYPIGCREKINKMKSLIYKSISSNLNPNLSQTPLSHSNSACESSLTQTHPSLTQTQLLIPKLNRNRLLPCHCSACCLCKAAASPSTVLEVTKQMNTWVCHHHLSLLVFHRSWPSSSLVTPFISVL